jgi:MFS family permease
MKNNIRQKLSIPNKYLILIAGIVWMFAGTMVVKTGAPVFINQGSYIFSILLAASVFSIFYFFIFSKLVDKHTTRISKDNRKNMFVMEFFDKKSYLVMLLMVFGGITIRKFGILPAFVIGFFYVGIGLALFSCGMKFVYEFMNLAL